MIMTLEIFLYEVRNILAAYLLEKHEVEVNAADMEVTTLPFLDAGSHEAMIKIPSAFDSTEFRLKYTPAISFKLQELRITDERFIERKYVFNEGNRGDKA